MSGRLRPQVSSLFRRAERLDLRIRIGTDDALAAFDLGRHVLVDENRVEVLIGIQGHDARLGINFLASEPELGANLPESKL